MPAILFDLGNTLIDYHGSADAWLDMERRGFRAVHVRFGDRPGTPDWPRFQAAMERSIQRVWAAAIEGHTNASVRLIVAGALHELGLPEDEEVLARAASDYCPPISAEATAIPGAAVMLDALKSAGYRLGLVSNTFWPREHHEADLARFGLLDYFDALTFSGEIGLWKPDRRIFHHALAALDATPTETLFVGDRLVDDVGGAQRAGLRGVLRRHGSADNDLARGAALGIVADAQIDHLIDLPDVARRLLAVGPVAWRV